ncbi:hypothetical protein C8T65DRAFT_634051 [Cerioporus squamosus]|nr:hypothetical protein C8T65DRAFT_634051 [Cerioporus squamosus]
MNSPPPSYGSVDPAYPTPPSENPWEDETTPLNAHGVRRDSRILRWTLVVFGVLTMLVICQNAGIISTLADDVPASRKAAMRDAWRLEKVEHSKKVVEWTREREDHRQELHAWEIERETREHDRATWKEEVEAERKAWWRTSKQERAAWRREVEAERRDWWSKENSERKRWKQAAEAERRDWWVEENDKRKHWQEEVETERRDWWTKVNSEREQWKKKVDTERQDWAREGEEWARRREEEERHRKEIEYRRQGVWWSEPWKSKGCYASGIQSYSAHLFDIPEDLNWLDVCMDMPNHIDGRPFDKPNKCERDKTHVWATWMLDEPQCAVYWDRFDYVGCSPGQNGIKRYKAHLLNLHHGDDWDRMCSTTPANILGVHYDRPTVCVDEKDGRIGIWDIPDPYCDGPQPHI